MLGSPTVGDPLSEGGAAALGQLPHGGRAKLAAAAKLSVEQASVCAPVEDTAAVCAALAPANAVLTAAVSVGCGVNAHGACVLGGTSWLTRLRARPVASAISW
jgi:hypothetical protein